MKKTTGFACLLFMLATVGVYAQSVDLNTGIKNAAEYFVERLQHGITIAVVNIRSDSPDLSGHIVGELTEYLVNSRLFTVAERNFLDTIQSEMNYQLSGDVSDESAQSIGKQIGAQIVITGGIQPFGNEYRLDLRALSVETGEILEIRRQDIKADSRLLAIAGNSFTVPASVSKERRERLELGAGFPYFFHNATISGIEQKKEIFAFVLNFSVSEFFWDAIGIGLFLNIFSIQGLRIKVMDQYIPYKGSEFAYSFGLDAIIGPVFRLYQRSNFILPVSAGVHYAVFTYGVYSLGYFSHSFGLGANVSGEYHINKNLYFLVRLQLSLDFCSIADDYDAESWQTSWLPSPGINPSIGIGFKF